MLCRQTHHGPKAVGQPDTSLEGLARITLHIHLVAPSTGNQPSLEGLDTAKYRLIISAPEPVEVSQAVICEEVVIHLNSVGMPGFINQVGNTH
jgi:hypothetical protein